MERSKKRRGKRLKEIKGRVEVRRKTRLRGYKQKKKERWKERILKKEMIKKVRRGKTGGIARAAQKKSSKIIR